MDLFTHLMFGFLLSSWGSGSFYNDYVILGCFVAILPDVDVFFWPISNRYPALRHHGVTHTLLFCLIAPSVVYGFAGLLWGMWDLKLLILLLVCSCMHLFSDLITTWGVPLFYPVSKKHYKLGIDLAVNPLVILFFFIGLVLLQLGKTHTFKWLDISRASDVLGLSYVAYFGFRVSMKAGLMLRKRDRGFSAIPTVSPFRWKLAKREETATEIRVTVRKRKLRVLEDSTYIIPKRSTGKIEKDEDYISDSYKHPELHPWASMWKYPYYEIVKDTSGVMVKWHSVEMPARFASVVHYSKDGKVKVYDTFMGNDKR